MMLPSEVLILSILAASSAAHFSPVLQDIRSDLQSSSDVNWAQIRLPGGTKLPMPRDGYQCYISSYPSPNEWLSWNHLWDLNREQVLSSNGGDTYIQHYVEEGILQVARESEVDPRLVLAVVMQETKGKAGGECEEDQNCGIIRGGRSFDDQRPKESILRMLREGVKGASGRPGLADRLERSYSPYTAMWRYHQDRKSIESPASEMRYVSNVANRLSGWNGRGKGFEACGRH